MISLKRIEYEIINETKCGEEELSILIGGFAKEYGLETLLDALVNLIEQGLLICTRGTSNKVMKISSKDLEEYVNKRKKSGENLIEYPEVCKELYFFATDEGIKYLNDEDQPISN